MYLIKNAQVITPTGLMTSDVLVEGNKILQIGVNLSNTNAYVLDLHGLYLSPGFIDIHVHGGGGHTLMSGQAEDVLAMCDAHGKQGTTSIVPTTLAAPIPKLLNAIDAVRDAQPICKQSNILGVHLEGPFLSHAQSGAQNPADLVTPTAESIHLLLNRWPGGIRMMGAAPECDGVLELMPECLKHGVTLSIAHSNATFEDVELAINVGFTDVTHIYSGCSSVIRKNGFRIAGVVEAGLNFDELSVQVIADLRHLPISLLKLIYKCKGPERISLVTDGLEYSAADLVEGAIYKQENGIETIYEDHVMKLPNRQAFAGSVATSRELVYNMYKYVGVPLHDAVTMATKTPAECIGLGDRKGLIEVGYDADLIAFNDDLQLSLRMVNGKLLQWGDRSYE